MTDDGKDAEAGKFKRAKAEAQPDDEPIYLNKERDKRQKFIHGKLGGIAAIAPNVRTALSLLNVSLAYNAFTHRVLIDWHDDQSERALTDSDVIQLKIAFDDRFHFFPGKDLIYEVLCDDARKASFHPVRDYLDGLAWDNEPRL